MRAANLGVSNLGEHECRVILEADDVRRALDRIAHEIIERNKGVANLVVLGILHGGVPIAARVAQRLSTFSQTPVASATLDVTLHRDDLSTDDLRGPTTNGMHKATSLVDVAGKKVVLVDDVLYTGRTIGAALRAIGEYGRPAAVQLAVLVDRGHREMPFQADFVGKNLPTNRLEHVVATINGVSISRGSR